MNELYPEQMAALKNVDLPNGAHHFALETRNNQLSFESFGDGKRYVWNHGADRWEPAE
jgi:hypothetical protein